MTILPTLSGCSSVAWERNYQAGLQQAVQQRRRALIQFMSAWNAETHEMEEVFADPKVQHLIANFVPIRVDAVMDKTLADQYGVQALPTFFVVRPDLTVAGTAVGRMDADRFRMFLIKHTFD